MAKKVIFTIDVDMVDYLDPNTTLFNEFEQFYPFFEREILKKYNISTSWFLRIDSQIEREFGRADHFFFENAQLLDQLKENRGEIGWHHHSYKFENNKWLQETNEEAVVTDIKKYGPIARRMGLDICRMGWGYQTNRTMALLNEQKFVVDSSSIPRPKYNWDISFMDWENAATQPYHPSKDNYKQPGEQSLSILEVPMTTSRLNASYDKEEVLRYVNPAYHHQKFKESFEEVKDNNFLCTILHPYEVMQSTKEHALISFSMTDLKENIEFLLKNEYDFISYKEYLKTEPIKN